MERENYYCSGLHCNKSIKDVNVLFFVEYKAGGNGWACSDCLGDGNFKKKTNPIMRLTKLTYHKFTIDNKHISKKIIFDLNEEHDVLKNKILRRCCHCKHQKPIKYLFNRYWKKGKQMHDFVFCKRFNTFVNVKEKCFCVERRVKENRLFSISEIKRNREKIDKIINFYYLVSYP